MTARIIWTEIKLLTREPLTLFVGLAFPVLLMVLLAGSFGNDPDPDMGGIGGTDFYVPVYACASIAVMGFLGVPTHLAAYRERGVLSRFRVAGVSAGTLMVAQVVLTALLAIVGAVIMVAIGLAGFDLNSPTSLAGVAAGIIVGSIAFAAIGVVLGVVMPTARAAQSVGLLLFFGLFFISGGGPPPHLMPNAVNTATDWTPMGPLIASISEPWHGDGTDFVALLALGVIAGVAAVVAQRRLARV